MMLTPCAKKRVKARCRMRLRFILVSKGPWLVYRYESDSHGEPFPLFCASKFCAILCFTGEVRLRGPVLARPITLRQRSLLPHSASPLKHIESYKGYVSAPALWCPVS